jgi:transcriptional/translational regulatory protein YebC/TACO1
MSGHDRWSKIEEEDLDDVQRVHANFEIDEALMEQMA